MSSVRSRSPRLVALLREQRDALLGRWISRIRRDPEIARLAQISEAELLDHIPDLLDEITEAVAASSPPVGEERGRALGSVAPVLGHAHRRLQAGFSIANALRELSHLRAAIMDLAFESGTGVSREDAQLVHATFDEVMRSVAVEMERIDKAHIVEREARLADETRFRERFMAILGHDLRNPLTSITFTMASLMARADLPPDVIRSLRRAASSAERMERLVRDLLDVTRIRLGGGIQIVPVPTDLHDICRHVVDELRIAHPQRIIVLEAHGSGRGLWDADRLAQAISNVLGNALAYSPPHTPVRLVVDEQNGAVVVAVHNEGAPIPPEVMATLFDPFRRGAPASSASRSSAGLGLGLFICQQIVHAHGGAIDVTSLPDLGTTVTISLPRGPRDAA